MKKLLPFTIVTMKLNIKTLLLCLTFATSLTVFAHENCEEVSNCQEQDYIALRALYLSTDGDNWDNNTNWFTADEFMMNPMLPTEGEYFHEMRIFDNQNTRLQ